MHERNNFRKVRISTPICLNSLNLRQYLTHELIYQENGGQVLINALLGMWRTGIQASEKEDSGCGLAAAFIEL